MLDSCNGRRLDHGLLKLETLRLIPFACCSANGMCLPHYFFPVVGEGDRLLHRYCSL